MENIILDRNYDEEFFNYLNIKGLKYIDNRSKGGCLWIDADEDYFQNIKTINHKFGITFRYKQNVKCLDGKSGWWMKQQIIKNDTQIDFVNETEHDDTSITINESKEKDNKSCYVDKTTIRDGVDLPMLKIKWDIEEMVALVAVYYKCKNDKNVSVNDELNILSEQLNYRADKLGIPHDDKYRNLNGMKLMYQNIRFIDSHGESGMSSVSEMMSNVFSMYSLDPQKFRKILLEYNNNYGDLGKHSEESEKITQISALDNTYDNSNIMLVYDEILVIYYLYRCLNECTLDKYYEERERIIHLLDQISVHYGLERKDYNEIIDNTIKMMNCFYQQNRNERLKRTTFNSFINEFLCKFEYYSIDTIEKKVFDLKSRYKNNQFTDDNFFQIYCLEDADCLSKRINTLDFSVRTISGLMQIKVDTIFDLLCLSASDLYAIKNIGDKSVREISDFAKMLKRKFQVVEKKDEIKLDEIKLDINLERIFDGDFSQIDEKENPWILKYKQAFEVLDPFIVKECKNNPKYVCKVVEALNNYQRDYYLNESRKIEVEKLISKLTETKKNNRFFLYAQAYNLKKIDEIKCFYEDYYDSLANISDRFNCVESKDFNLLLAFLKWCSFDIKEEILSFIDAEINSRSTEVILWRVNGDSLECIGEKMGVTRERVRQIEVKAQEKFDRAMRYHNYFEKIYAELNGKSVILYDDVKMLFNGDSTHIWYFLKNSKCKQYKYNKKNDCIIVENEELNKKYREFIGDLPFCTSEDEVMNFITQTSHINNNCAS